MWCGDELSGAEGSMSVPVKTRFSADEMRELWPQAAGELRGFAEHLEAGRAGITADQIRLAVQMACAYLDLCDAVWPGKPKWEPTPEQPQQNFYEAVAESV